jgi:hypothetical protein
MLVHNETYIIIDVAKKEVVSRYMPLQITALIWSYKGKILGDFLGKFLVHTSLSIANNSSSDKNSPWKEYMPYVSHRFDWHGCEKNRLWHSQCELSFLVSCPLSESFSIVFLSPSKPTLIPISIQLCSFVCFIVFSNHSKAKVIWKFLVVTPMCYTMQYLSVTCVQRHCNTSFTGNCIV